MAGRGSPRGSRRGSPTWSWRRRSGGWLLALALAVPIVTGCELLFPGLGPPPGGDVFPDASPLAEFKTGHASIAIAGGETIELKQLHGEAELYKTFGATVTWEGPDGWYLRVSEAGEEIGITAPGYLTIERIVDGEHWTTRDPSRCVLDSDKADKTGIKGSATCKGLQWHDALAGYGFRPDDEDLVPDQPKFDATITFEALPE